MEGWERRQNRYIEELGDSPRPGSGNQWDKTGDGIGTFKEEVKTTDFNQITITKKILQKIKREAIEDQKLPMLIFDIQEIEVWDAVPHKVMIAMKSVWDQFQRGELVTKEVK